MVAGNQRTFSTRVAPRSQTVSQPCAHTSGVFLYETVARGCLVRDVRDHSHDWVLGDAADWSVRRLPHVKLHAWMPGSDHGEAQLVIG
jgi:hypothetical protein